MGVVSFATQSEAKGERGKYQGAQAGAITANEYESYRQSIRSIFLNQMGACSPFMADSNDVCVEGGCGGQCSSSAHRCRGMPNTCTDNEG